MHASVPLSVAGCGNQVYRQGPNFSSRGDESPIRSQIGTMANAQDLHDGWPQHRGPPGDASPPAAERPSWRERLGALRNLPPFLKLVWRTSPALTLSQALLRVARALLPVATLYVGKLIIDEVVLLAQAPHTADELRQWLASGLLDRIGWLLALEFGLAVLSDVLGRAVSLLDSMLSERFSNETSIRLMEHAATLDLEDFEDSELQDRLERARRQASGRATLIGQLFAPGAGRGDRRQLCRRACSSTRRGSSPSSRSPSCPRSSARPTSTRRAIRSTTPARRSGASWITCGRRARARRRRRK